MSQINGATQIADASIPNSKLTTPPSGGGGGSSSPGYGALNGTPLRTYEFASTTESWTADAGTLTQTGGALQLAGPNSDTNCTALEPSSAANVADGEVEVDYEVVSSFIGSNQSDSAVVFRATDANNYYMVIFRGVSAGGAKLEWYKKVAGTYTSLGTASPPGLRDTAIRRLMIRFVGSRLEAYVNGTFVADLLDSTYTTGRVGVRVYKTTVKAHAVRVTSLSASWPL